MPLQINGYRVFIASPGGLNSERRAFKKVLTEYSEDEALERKVSFIPVGWEETLGGVGRPQELINKQVESCDFFLLLLWDRWGSPPSDKEGTYSSGTEEEFCLAFECLKNKNKPMRQIVVLFKGVDERQLSDPGPQLQKLLEFRRRIETDKTLFYKTFDTIDEFTRIVRKHLSRWVQDDELKRMIQTEFHFSLDSHQPIELPVVKMKSLFSLPTEELISKAEKLADQGSYADAEALFAHAVIERNTLYVLNRYGRFLRRFNRIAHSQVIFERAQIIAEEEKNVEALAFALSNLGVIYRKKGNLDKALQMHKKSNHLANSLGLEGQRLLAYNYANIGQTLISRSNFKGAEVMIRKAIKIREKSGDIGGLANSFGGLAVLKRKCGDFEAAAKYFKISNDFSKKQGEKGLRAQGLSYGNLGLVYFQMGRLYDAEKYSNLSLSIGRKFGDKQGEAFNLALLARIFLLRNRLEEAEKLNEESYIINSQQEIFVGLAHNYFIRGKIAFQKGKIGYSKNDFEQSLGIERKNKNNEGIVSNLIAIGDVCISENRKEEAYKNWKEAFDICDKHKINYLKTEVEQKISSNFIDSGEMFATETQSSD